MKKLELSSLRSQLIGIMDSGGSLVLPPLSTLINHCMWNAIIPLFLVGRKRMVGWESPI